jgi:hypothetical protein
MMWESLMLICFGLSWPTSLYKSYVSRSVKGKSVFFLCLVDLGYLAGITNKLVHGYDVVLWLYVINFAMVFADIILYFRNRRIETLAQEPLQK